MQALTLNHWIEQLSKKVVPASDAAAECVQQVALRDRSNASSIATGGEHALHHLKRATAELTSLRMATDTADIVEHLVNFQHYARSAHSSVGLYMKEEAIGSSSEIRDAVTKCREAVVDLVADVDQLMELDEVQEARLSHRAKAAKDDARAIADTLLAAS